MDEAQALKSELEDRWDFFAEIYQIPFIDSPAELQKRVEFEVSRFINAYDSHKNLLLFHYGGHGDVDDGKYTLCMGNDGKSYGIYFKPIREQLLRCKSDIAILLDACEAEAARYRYYYHHTVEILAACAEHETTPVVGPESFTSGILRVLGSCDRDLTLGELFEGLKKLENPRLLASPAHCYLRTSEHGSITFQRYTRDPGAAPEKSRKGFTATALNRFFQSIFSIWY